MAKFLPGLKAAQASEDGKMPFMAHLGELRHRIVVGLIALGVGFAVTFNFSERIITWLARPLPVKLAFLEPTEPFWVNMKVALVAGAFLVLPVLLYEVWAFIAPGLLPHERKFALPFVILSTVCFFVGATFALTVIVPFAVTFLVGYKTSNLVATISVNRYVDFVLKFTIAFGLVFELPLALTLGSRMGLVTPEFLAKNPAHLTPMLEDKALPNGCLWESCAIMQYLSNKHGLENFYPKAPARRAMIDSAMFYLVGTLYPYVARATYPTLSFPQYAGEVGKLSGTYRFVRAQLRGQKAYGRGGAEFYLGRAVTDLNELAEKVAN